MLIEQETGWTRYIVVAWILPCNAVNSKQHVRDKILTAVCIRKTATQTKTDVRRWLGIWHRSIFNVTAASVWTKCAVLEFAAYTATRRRLSPQSARIGAQSSARRRRPRINFRKAAFAAGSSSSNCHQTGDASARRWWDFHARSFCSMVVPLI